MIKLDLKDRRLLYELDNNSRQSNAVIGKKIRLNKNTVNYKIKRLEQGGVILGYYPVIDNSKLGYFNFRGYFKFFNAAPKNEEEIINWLKKDKRVVVVTRIETTYDFALIVLVKDIYELDQFLSEFKGKFRKYLWDERMDIFSKVYHFKRNYFIKGSKNNSYEIIGENKIAECDDLDIKILRILAKNARTPIIDISEKTKIPPKTVAFRIRKLEIKKVIQGYRVNINLAKIGYEYYKINMILNDFNDYDKLLEFVKMHPNVIYYDRTLSNLDFEIDVEIENKEKLLNLLGEIKLKFSIRSTEILSFKEYEKLELLPWDN